MRHSMAISMVTVLACFAARTAGQSPRIDRPALPEDASGVYRLSLDRALGKIPLVVLLEVRTGTETRAVALPVHQVSMPWPADPSGLTVRDGRIHGTLNVDVMPLCGTHPERLQGKRNPKRPRAEDYRLEPAQTVTFTLDVNCEGRGGAGTYEAADPPQNLPFPGRTGTTGAVSVVRQAIQPLPEEFDLDLYMYAALGDLMPEPAAWLRATLKAGGSSGIRLRVKPADKADKSDRSLTIGASDLSLREGRLEGRIRSATPGEPGTPFTLELNGGAIGRQLFGTVTCVYNGARATTSWVGFLHDSAAWRFPLDSPSTQWTWAHDAPADPALIRQALEEAQRPVLPGQPGEAGFWTWRTLARGKSVSAIYPPTFDIKETEGAAQYRFTLKGAKGASRWGIGDDEIRKVTATFTADKPWRSVAPAWKDLPAGLYHLTVTPLDADGRELPGPMRLGILDKESAKPAVKELNVIPVYKRPPFGGPYFATRDVSTGVALDASRWHREMRSPAAKGIGSASGTFAGGESSFGWSAATHIWAGLANRALTRDPAERAMSEHMLAFIADEIIVHQRITDGMFYAYKGYTPLSRWNAEAVLDAWIETGDPRWKAMALAYGRALVRLQNENGSFGSTKGPGTPPEGFFARWQAGNPSFGASELLYALGRIRRDLKTDEFLEAENKALAWMKNRAVRDRFWPIYVGHSMSQGYPVWMHSMSGLFFVRYLLECARPEDRDVELAVEVARWAEDFGVDWSRAPEGPQTGGSITPVIPAGDRTNSDPVAVNLLAAIAFEHLARATGDRLWRAKGEALAAAVLRARDPKSGYLRAGGSLRADLEGVPFDRQHEDLLYRGSVGCRTWAIQLLREYAALKTEEHIR